MPILNIELAEYRTLEKRAESAEEREKKLSVEISVLKREHENEIEQLVKDGKVRCIDIVYKDRSFSGAHKRNASATLMMSRMKCISTSRTVFLRKNLKRLKHLSLLFSRNRLPN